jgi:MSHA biogenesis protein MshI
MLGNIIKGLKRLSTQPSAQLAVHLTGSTLSLVERSSAKIAQCGSTSYGTEGWQQALRKLLSATTRGRDVHLILSADFYQLVQLDKPVLSEQEMLQALPWQVKDLVSISAEDIVADYIDLPVNATQQAKINVVVASLQWLKLLVAEVGDLGLNIVSIQPEEWLATRLVATSGHATMLVVHQPEQEVLIQIVRDGVLYFSRRTRGFNQLHLSTEAELRGGTLDRLQLELQRSMDYFESQLKQPPVRDIRLLMTQSALVGELLSQNGFSRVDNLTSIPLADTLTSQQLLSCWPAVAVLCQPLPEHAV